MRQSRPATLLWKELLSAPTDRALIDAGVAGELLVARVRFWLSVVIVLVPVMSLIVNPRGPENLIAMGATLISFLAAAIILRVVRSSTRVPHLGVLTSVLDVTLVSGTQLAFLIQGMPSTAVNSRTAFMAYFLALGATCLRWDVRICMTAGALAVVQYLGIVAAAASRWPATLTEDLIGHGQFDWGQQFGRVVFLAAFTVVAMAIIRQSVRLRFTSTHDALTGISNRAYFEERLEEELLRSRRSGLPVSLALVDLDHFKAVNDAHGHDAGDAALRSVAGVLRNAVRGSDIVARWGGEEFVLVLPETGSSDAFRKVDLLRAAVAASAIRLPNGDTIRFTLSGGVAAAPSDGDTLQTLFAAADERLRQAKASGRDRVVTRSDPNAATRPLGVRGMATPDRPTRVQIV
ncbi:MAG: GGDEF domain-containing protein [Gemmatimonadaceae bacterium]